MGTPKNNIRKIIDYITVSVLILGTIVGTVIYLEEKSKENAVSEYKTKIQSLESLLASVDRGLKEDRYYDVRKLMLSSTDKSCINSDMFYFKDKNFYAQYSDEYWKYNKMSTYSLIPIIKEKFKDEEYINQLILYCRYRYPNINLSDSLLQIYILNNYQNIIDSNYINFCFASDYIYIWANEKKTITFLTSMGQIDEMVKITLTKSDYKDLQESFLYGTSFATWMTDKDTDSIFNFLKYKDKIDVLEFLHFRDDYYINDIVTHLYMKALFAEMKLFMDIERTKGSIIIKTIQKTGNVMYFQLLETYKNVPIEGVGYGTVYKRIETIIIATKDGLYQINISVPSLDPIPNSEVDSKILSWLNNFKIIID